MNCIPSLPRGLNPYGMPVGEYTNGVLGPGGTPKGWPPDQFFIPTAFGANDRPTLERWLGFARSWLILVLLPVVVVFSYAYRLIQALIYALIGLIFAKYSHAALDYMALVRLELITITPVVVLDTVFGLFGVKVPYWWIVCFFIAMGCLYFGVKANATPPPVPITSVDPYPRSI